MYDGEEAKKLNKRKKPTYRNNKRPRSEKKCENFSNNIRFTYPSEGDKKN